MTERIVRILVVDDNPADVEVVRTMLGRYPRAQFEVESIPAAERCLDVLREKRFDLILLDYNLPGEDGLSFLRRASAVEGIPPIIMLSGGGDERLAAEAMRTGAYDYFPKGAITSVLLARAIHQALEKYELDQQLENTEHVVFTLATAVEAKDPTTGEHLRKMKYYAARLGDALGLGAHELTILKYGAILHDIGKIAVSEAILRKPGSLDDLEWQEMRTHPVVGEGICSRLRFAAEVGPLIRHHHERWDGGGYVDGLSGDGIPFLARVISVVDAFDSMSSDRPYRPALPRDEVIRRLSEGAGSHWDPTITHTFVDLLAKKKLAATRA